MTELYLDRIFWDSSTLDEPKLLLVPEVFHSRRPLPMLHTLDLTGMTAASAADLIHISAHVGATLKCLNLVDILLNHTSVGSSQLDIFLYIIKTLYLSCRAAAPNRNIFYLLGVAAR
jgi:hypothetical protein